MKPKQTQITKIENHLLVHGKITSWKAIQLYRITRLSEYIRILRHEKDWDINSINMKNSKTHWTEYRLVNYPNG